MSKNILILTTPFRPNIGGVETHLDDLIYIGGKKNYKFYVLTYQPLVTRVRGDFLEYGPNYTIIRIPWIRLNLFHQLEQYPVLEFIYLFPGLFVVGLIFLVLKGFTIRTIHAQGLVAGVMGVILGKLFFKKVIISTHSIYNFPNEGFYPKFVRFIFRNCKKVLTLSNQSRREAIHLGVPAEKVSTFKYWVDQRVFTSKNEHTAREKLGLPAKNFICLFVGRLIAVKGINELLEAAESMEKDFKFLIIGAGPMDKEIENASKKNLNIIFIGRVKNNKLPLFYVAADVLIVPSIHEEGYGRVILEALSCGLPVIGANRGGIKEVITKEVGKLITISPSNIKTTLEYFRKNKSELESLAANARNYAKQHFSEKNARMILKHYE